MPVRRFDQGSLRSPKRLENGWLKLDAYLTRVGVFSYRNPDGSERKELRLPEEVFHQDSLESFSLVPLTNGHPPDLLDATNTKEYAVGSVGEVVSREESFVRASLFVTDANTIEALESGKQELSCGYTCDLEEVSGTWEGVRYDAIQRNIRGNHAALVLQGRAGPSVRARLDAKDAVMVKSSHFDTAEQPINPKELAVKTKIRIDGVEYEVSEQVAQAYTKATEHLTAKLDVKGDELSKTKTELEKVNARLDAKDEELQKTQQSLKDAADPTQLQTRVKERVSLEVEARKHLGEDIKLDGMEDQAIRVQVIQKFSPSFQADGKSSDYIQARYDAVLDIAPSEETSAIHEARTVITENRREDAQAFDPSAARKRQAERNREAWKSN